MNKWKRLIYIVLACVLVVAMAVPAFGDDIYDAKKKQRELEQQLRDSESRLADLRAQVASAQQAVNEIDRQIAEVQAVIDGYESQKASLQEKIDALQRQIDAKQAEIDHEYALMSMRIKFLYENMDSSYIETFLTAESFSDALNKVQYQIELTDYDRKEMDKLQDLQDDIKDNQDQIESQKKEIDSLIEAQNSQKVVLDEMMAIRAEALAEAQAAEANEEEQNAWIASMLADQKAEVSRMVEEYNREHPGEIIWTGGDFMWPLPNPYGPGWITSWYGWRDDPFGGGYTSYHNGLDIGAPGGTPIYAVLDGLVVISADGWNGGCGNYTVLYHGNNLYTEYMHQSWRNVNVGDYVMQGDTIGYVGTTGSSTGNHLHLGCVVSDHGFDYTCRVDPCPYLGLY